MPETRSDKTLTARLRAGDPATGDRGLDPRQRVLMRQRILAAGGERRRQTTSWLLPAATAMALLALALGLALRQPQPPFPRPVAESRRTVLATTASQQIQFTTDNGTLVVWVLQPRATS